MPQPAARPRTRHQPAVLQTGQRLISNRMVIGVAARCYVCNIRRGALIRCSAPCKHAMTPQVLSLVDGERPPSIGNNASK